MTLPNHIQEIVREAREFLKTEEGKQQIDDAVRRAHETSIKLKELSRIDPDALHRPMTI